MVSLSHLAGRFLLIAGIGGPSATCYKQSWSSVTVYSARLTKRGWSRAIHSHGRPGILCTTARLDITPKTTEQNRIVRTGKSEAEVTNNKKSTGGIVLLKLSTDRHEALYGLSATAESRYSFYLLLVVARTHTKLACCAFSVAALFSWNSLHADILLYEYILTFKRQLKNLLFKLT